MALVELKRVPAETVGNDRDVYFVVLSMCLDPDELKSLTHWLRDHSMTEAAADIEEALR